MALELPLIVVNVNCLLAHAKGAELFPWLEFEWFSSLARHGVIPGDDRFSYRSRVRVSSASGVDVIRSLVDASAGVSALSIVLVFISAGIGNALMWCCPISDT